MLGIKLTDLVAKLDFNLQPDAGAGKAPKLTSEEAIATLRDYLKTDQHPTIRKAAATIRRSASYTSKLPPWIEYMARKTEGRKRRSVSPIQFTEKMLAARPGTDVDPAEVAEAFDSPLGRCYVENANADDRARFHSMSEEEKRRELEKLEAEQEDDRRSRRVR
jgi:hypothetical protein